MTRILASRKFLMLYAMAGFHLFQGYYLSNSFKQIGFQHNLSDSTLTYIGSFGALFNGCCKILFAAMLDCFKFKHIYVVILMMVCTALVGMHFATDPISFGTCVFVCFMCDGSMTSMLPVVTLEVFGLKRCNQVYGFMFSVFGVAAMSGTLFVGTI